MGIGPWRLRPAVWSLRRGGVIAYPTEAVYGLGCDPLDGDAVARVLRLKGRSAALGVILIAADSEQLDPYVEWPGGRVPAAVRRDWPGFVTWVVPARRGVPEWLTGGRNTLAVRVTAHPAAAALCRGYEGPLVSTSANPHGLSPARTPLKVRTYFGRGIDGVLVAPLGGEPRPSPIRYWADGRYVRR